MNKEEDLKSSPLIAAAAIGDLETVQSLFEQGYPNKNETTNHGSTAILIAAWKGHLSVVSFLAENGADLVKRKKWFISTPRRCREQSFGYRSVPC